MAIPNYKPLNYNLDTKDAESRMFDIFKETNKPNRSAAQNELYGGGNLLDEKPKEETSYIDNMATPDAFESWLKKKDKEKETASPSTPIDFNKDEGPSSPVDVEEASKFDAGAGGLAALNQLPGIVNNLSQKPTTGGEANNRNFTSAMQFGQIGMAAGGPVGLAVGAFAGWATSAISQQGWFKEQLKKNDELVAKKEEEAVQQRKNDYVGNRTSDQLKAEAQAYAQALGYSGQGLTS